MKKSLLITLIAFVLATTPALAVSSNANEHAQDHTQNINAHQVYQPIHNNEDDAPVTPIVTLPAEVTTTPVVDPTATPSSDKSDDVLDADTQVKNQDSQTTPADCDPSADYKNHGQFVSCVAHEHLGSNLVAEAAHSNVGKNHVELTPSPTATISPTVTITPPVTSPEEELNTFNPLLSLGDLFNRFFGFFKHLL